MSIDELITLKDRIEQLIVERIEDEKNVLTAKLEAIRRFEAKANSRPQIQAVARGAQSVGRNKPAPKYKNPVTGETWAGRGMQPRWMRRAIEAGHTREDFLIGS